MTHRRDISRACGVLLVCLVWLGMGCQQPLNPNPRFEDQPDGVRLAEAMKSAERAAKTKDPERAEALYRQATTIYPSFAAAWNNMGLTLMAQNRWSEADEAFSMASELATLDPRPLYNRGIVRLKRGYAEQAVPFFEEALKVNDGFLPALRGVVRAQVLIRDTDEQTLAWLERAIMLETDDDWLKYLRMQRLQIQAELSQEKPSWVQ